MGREVGALRKDGLKCEVEESGHWNSQTPTGAHFCCVLLGKHILFTGSLMDPFKIVLRGETVDFDLFLSSVFQMRDKSLNP